MSKLIEGSLADGGRVVEDAWTMVCTAEGVHAAPDRARLIVPLSVWNAERDALLARGVPVGVRLEGSDDPAVLVADLPKLGLIAIDFPKFTDGRGYSIARLLRERHGWTGPLRAVGDVLRDQLFYMLRCGFDQFVLKHDDHVDAALTAYRDFTEAYQTSVERKRPLFARRAEAAA